MPLEEYRSALEEEIGEIISIDEPGPGVYYVESYRNGLIGLAYYVIPDAAPIARTVQNYGKKMDGLRLYAVENDTSGWQIVQYELNRYNITSHKSLMSESEFRDASLHAMEAHPEYFGMFPVPFHTPCGYTLRHWTLANGIYWLETSTCEELLAVCCPVWEAELSPAALAACKMTKQDIEKGMEESTCYIFFTKEASCVPLYELMETRKEWDGTVIDRPALMNAVWKFMPEYAMQLNGQENARLKGDVDEFWQRTGIKPFPEPHRDRIVYMYPETGTDFLLLR